MFYLYTLCPTFSTIDACSVDKKGDGIINLGTKDHSVFDMS